MMIAATSVTGTGGLNRKPWASLQPSAFDSIELIDRLDTLGDGAHAQPLSRPMMARTISLEPSAVASRTNDWSILSLSKGKPRR